MKYFVKQTGKEVKIGDSLVQTRVVKNGSCDIKHRREVLVTSEAIPQLLKWGWITNEPVNEAPASHAHPTIKDAITHLAKRKNWKPGNVENYLGNLTNLSPTAVFSILLFELALLYDENYSNNIRNTDVVYAWGNVNGQILKINTKDIKNFDIALFRSEADLMNAIVSLSNAGFGNV